MYDARTFYDVTSNFDLQITAADVAQAIAAKSWLDFFTTEFIF